MKFYLQLIFGKPWPQRDVGNTCSCKQLTQTSVKVILAKLTTHVKMFHSKHKKMKSIFRNVKYSKQMDKPIFLLCLPAAAAAVLHSPTLRSNGVAACVYRRQQFCWSQRFFVFHEDNDTMLQQQLNSLNFYPALKCPLLGSEILWCIHAQQKEQDWEKLLCFQLVLVLFLFVWRHKNLWYKHLFVINLTNSTWMLWLRVRRTPLVSGHYIWSVMCAK